MCGHMVKNKKHIRVKPNMFFVCKNMFKENGWLQYIAMILVKLGMVELFWGG